MAISRVGSVNTTNGESSSFNVGHTVPSGANFLAVFIGTEATAVSGVTFASQALTRAGAGKPSGDDGNAELWYLIDPPVTSGTVSVTLGGNDEYTAIVASFENVGGIRATATTGSSDEDISVLVESQPGDLVISVSTEEDEDPLNAMPGGILIGSAQFDDQVLTYAYSQPASGGSSTTVTYEWDDNVGHGLVASSLFETGSSLALSTSGTAAGSATATAGTEVRLSGPVPTSGTAAGSATATAGTEIHYTLPDPNDDWTYVDGDEGSASAGGFSGDAVLNLPLPTGVQNGDLVVVVVSGYTTVAASTSGWTKHESGGTGDIGDVYWRIWDSGDGLTNLAFTASAGFFSSKGVTAVSSCWRPAETPITQDDIEVSTGSGATATSQSTTGTGVACLTLLAWATTGNHEPAPPPEFSQSSPYGHESSSRSAGIFEYQHVTGGMPEFDIDFGSSTSWSVTTLTFSHPPTTVFLETHGQTDGDATAATGAVMRKATSALIADNARSSSSSIVTMTASGAVGGDAFAAASSSVHKVTPGSAVGGASVSANALMATSTSGHTAGEAAASADITTRKAFSGQTGGDAQASATALMHQVAAGFVPGDATATADARLQAMASGQIDGDASVDASAVVRMVVPASGSTIGAAAAIASAKSHKFTFAGVTGDAMASVAATVILHRLNISGSVTGSATATVVTAILRVLETSAQVDAVAEASASAVSITTISGHAHGEGAVSIEIGGTVTASGETAGDASAAIGAIVRTTGSGASAGKATASARAKSRMVGDASVAGQAAVAGIAGARLVIHLTAGGSALITAGSETRVLSAGQTDGVARAAVGTDLAAVVSMAGIVTGVATTAVATRMLAIMTGRADGIALVASALWIPPPAFGSGARIRLPEPVRATRTRQAVPVGAARAREPGPIALDRVLFPTPVEVSRNVDAIPVTGGRDAEPVPIAAGRSMDPTPIAADRDRTHTEGES